MKRDIKYFKVNPGGNITAIVPGAFSAQQERTVALKILKKDPSIEQVGFWTLPRSKKALGRLEMAGGEFCGNATRSLAALMSRSKPFFLEVDGLSHSVKVFAAKKRASVTLPLKAFHLKNDTCKLPGITHVLSEERVTRLAAKKILRSHGLINEKASGVIVYRQISADLYEIIPIVWVHDIGTLYAETACASGTAALAYQCWKLKKIRALRIRQPSGAIFKTRIKSSLLTLDGPILQISEQTLSPKDAVGHG